MKYIFFLIILNALATKSCNKGEQNKAEEKYFTLLSSVAESWVAGINGGGSGTEYYFKTKINTDEKIVFDSAWINNKAYSVHLSKKRKSVSNEPITFFKGDTITIRVSGERQISSAARISYIVNNKKNYIEINDIKKQESVNRP